MLYSGHLICYAEIGINEKFHLARHAFNIVKPYILYISSQEKEEDFCLSSWISEADPWEGYLHGGLTPPPSHPDLGGPFNF